MIRRLISISEVEQSRSLQLYGAALALTHILSIYFWRAYPGAAKPSVCWPVFPHCETLDFLGDRPGVALGFYFIVATVSLVAFLTRKSAFGVSFLALSAILKLLFLFSDYRMMGNYHYMALTLQFAFLVLPEKKQVARFLLVLFYIAAGALKFNSDWLSGSAMIPLVFLQGKLLEVACAYVILLEMVIVPLVLFPRRDVRLFALIQLLIFHAFSWLIVGYFYPLTMFCLLSIFAFENTDFALPKNRWAWVFLAGFVALQIYPVVFEKNPSLTGRGRILALNMLDARTECETKFFIRSTNQTIEYTPTFTGYGVRIQCDPVVVVDHAKRTCRDQAKLKGFLDIDLDHQVRRISQPGEIEQFTFKNVCRLPLRIGALGEVKQ